MYLRESKKFRGKMSLKVSIVVPVYNVENFLPDCLDSLVSQTLKEIEIICINDGSTDNSPKILEEYAKKDPRIQVIHQENSGVSYTRNKGLEHVRGEYTGFVDSDDWVDLDFFEKLYKTAQKHDADIAVATIVRKYQNSKTRKKVLITEEKIYDLAASKFKITETPRKSYVFNKIYKTAKLKENNVIFPNYDYCEDIYFSIRALYYLKKLVTVPTTTYYYRVNYSSITRVQPSDAKLMALLNSRKDLIDFICKHHIICEEKFYIKYKIFYRILGVPIMKVSVWQTYKKYYLFGFIPIFKKEMTITL